MFFRPCLWLAICFEVGTFVSAGFGVERPGTMKAELFVGQFISDCSCALAGTKGAMQISLDSAT